LKVALISLYHFESFAVRLLFSILQQEGTPVEAVFFKDLRTNRITEPTDKEVDLLIELLRERNVSVAALSVRSPFRPVAVRLTETIRRRLGIPVVWGGTDAMLCPEEGIRHADAVCIGEGEQVLGKLARFFAGDLSVDDLSGAWVRSGDNITKGEPVPAIFDLDALPFPALLDPAKHFIDDDAFQDDPLTYNTRYDTMASRGCPFGCAYCCGPVLAAMGSGSRRVRKRSVQSVISELETAIEALPHIRRIFFVDEIFGVDRAWVEQFAVEYRRRIDLPFMVEMYPTTIRKETLKLLVEVGLESASVGIQSGDQKVRADYLRRPVTDDQLLLAGQLLDRFGVRPTYDLIMDMPFVNEAELRRTFELLCGLPRPYDLNMFSLVHFPKTKLTERLIKEKVITADQVEGRSRKSWDQWRMSLDYDRNPANLFYGSLISLLSRTFVPKPVIIGLSRSRLLRRYPRPLKALVNFTGLLKSAGRGFDMLVKGQLNPRTFGRYLRNLTMR
jgi:anaerobic magnesium-protoporphyrin IX monomethyl ester cyclase